MLRHADQPSADRALSRRQVTAWRNSMFLIFGLSGLGLASWVTRIPVTSSLGSARGKRWLRASRSAPPD